MSNIGDMNIKPKNINYRNIKSPKVIQKYQEKE